MPTAFAEDNLTIIAASDGVLVHADGAVEGLADPPGGTGDAPLPHTARIGSAHSLVGTGYGRTRCHLAHPANTDPMEDPLPTTTPRRLTLNLPLLALWIAAVGVAAIGYWMVQRGNAAQAEFYTAGGTDPLELLSSQSTSTMGGLLLAAGVVGLLIALATHARARSAAILAANTVTDAATRAPSASEELDDLDDDRLDEVDAVDVETDAADDADTVEPQPAAPAAEGVPAAESELEAETDAAKEPEANRV